MNASAFAFGGRSLLASSWSVATKTGSREKLLARLPGDERLGFGFDRERWLVILGSRLVEGKEERSGQEEAKRAEHRGPVS